MTFRSGLLNSIAFKAYNRRIDHPNSVFDWLSRDEEVVSLYQSDEKCNFIFTASAFRDLFILCARATATRPSAAPRATCRCSSSQATATRSAATATACAASSVFIVQAAPATSTQSFYKNARHELLNELGRIETYGDISRWLEERLAEQTETAPAENTESITVQPKAVSDFLRIPPFFLYQF